MSAKLKNGRFWPNWARKAAVAGRWCDGRRLCAVKYHQAARSCGFSGACLQMCDCGGLKSVFFACYTITTMQQQVYVGCHTLDSWRSRQPLPLLGLLQRAQKFAVPCKNTASKEQSPLNFSRVTHTASQRFVAAQLQHTVSE